MVATTKYGCYKSLLEVASNTTIHSSNLTVTRPRLSFAHHNQYPLHLLTVVAMFSIALLALSLVPQVLGCADHSNHIAPLHKRLDTTDNGPRVQTYWQYEASYNWGKLSPEYELCQTGTQQSPIALSFLQGLAHSHQPLFTGYDGNWTGEYYNWGYGPAFTFYHPEGDYSGLPTMEFDNQTLYCRGWHIHAPADHSVGGDRSKAELHYVQ